MKKLIFCAAALLLPSLAMATPGTYMTGQAGVNDIYPNGSGTTDLVGAAWGVGLGYLWGDNSVNYGLELDGLTYPDSTANQTVFVPGEGNFSADAKINGYNVSLLAVLKYTDCDSGWDVFVKAGGAYVNQDISLSIPSIDNNVAGTVSTNEIAPEAAVGVGYMFNPNIEVNLTADAVFADSGNNFNDKPIQNGNLLLGLTYHIA